MISEVIVRSNYGSELGWDVALTDFHTSIIEVDFCG